MLCLFGHLLNIFSYGLKEIRRHGEAGSVDLEAVAEERKRVHAIISEFAKEDVLNFDETAYFWKAPPDRGLATKQMSGKKKDKTRITIGFMVSCVGETFEPFFIGKYEKPRPFKGKPPSKLGLHYRHNKKAWMNTELFEG